MHINDKIEEIKYLISGISDDANEILSMLQTSIPIAETVVKRIIDRAEQARRIFSSEDVSHGSRNN